MDVVVSGEGGTRPRARHWNMEGEVREVRVGLLGQIKRGSWCWVELIKVGYVRLFDKFLAKFVDLVN